jgi:hypothetical protein
VRFTLRLDHNIHLTTRLMFSGLFGPKKRAAVEDEKRSRLGTSKLIPIPAQYSDIYSYGRDHVTEPRPRALLANNAVIVTRSHASPTSLGITRPRSSTQANAGTLEFLSHPEDVSGSFHNVWAQPSPFSNNWSQTVGDVPNLTGQVAIATSRPVFEGTYSDIYLGAYRDQTV